MSVLDSFGAFANRVMHVLRMGKLNEKDVKIIERLLIKTKKRNYILSKALLAALSGNERSKEDIKKFALLLETANLRICGDKEPFTLEERKELEKIFERHSLSTKAVKKFAFSIDELLTMELKNQLEKRPFIFEKSGKESVPMHGQREKEKIVY